MAQTSLVIVALPLDHATPGIVATSVELTRRMQAQTIVVHALPSRRMENERGRQTRIDEARAELEPHLAPLRAAGVAIRDVTIGVGEAAEVVVEAARRTAADMIVTGGGRPATVRRWVVGSVAEEVVRRAAVPVWVARGKPLADGGPILCPVDLSPESKEGVDAAIGMARLFRAPLSLLTVVSDEHRRGDMPKVQAQAREALATLIAAYDTEGLDVSMNVTVGDPASEIVDAAEHAGLMVVASRGYDPLVREWLGPVTARALRHSRCSILTIRHLAQGHAARMAAVARIADLYAEARALVIDGRREQALPLLESLAQQAPTNAAIQEAYAIALDHVGREVEASGRHALAELLRERLPRIP